MNIRQLQAALLALGMSPGPVDGVLGPLTLGAVERYLEHIQAGVRSHKAIPPWVVDAITTTREPLPSPTPLQTPSDGRGSGSEIRVGAWSMSWALRSPEKAAAKAARIGLTDISLMVNSVGKREWHLLGSEAQITKAGRIFRGHGITPHITTWIRPTDAWIDGIAQQLGTICMTLEAGSLDLDTESAWAHGSRQEHHAAQLFDQLASRGITTPVAVNDYASLQPVTRHLADRAAIVRPQAYSVSSTGTGTKKKPTTSRSVYWPGRTQDYAMRPSLWGRYRGGPKRLEMGLACYKQRFPGLTSLASMRKAWDTSIALGAEAIWYWSLGNMKGATEKAVAQLITESRR